MQALCQDKDSLKDKGTGQLSIKRKEGIGKGSKDSKPTIVVRNDVGKVLLNALLYPGIKMIAQKNSVVAIFHTSVIHMEVKYLDLFVIPFSNLGILFCSDQVSTLRLFIFFVFLSIASGQSSSCSLLFHLLFEHSLI